MKRELSPNSISDVIPFSYATCERLENTTTREKYSHCTDGNISLDGKWAWLVNGPNLEIISTYNGERLGAWCFGALNKIANVAISCVCELKSTNPKILVALYCDNHRSFLYVFDIKTSKITKGIEFPHKITAVEVISTHGGSNPANHILKEELRHMFGIVSVGTVAGYLYIVDLCLDEEGKTDENNPGTLLYLNSYSNDLQFKREEALTKQKHLSLTINAVNWNKVKLQEEGDMHISCIKFLPQMSCIAVGFNLGNFQLWNLSKLSLEFSSPIDKVLLPIIEFAFQEPENDPRLFCYLWIVRGTPRNDSSQDGIATLSLYAMMFSQKSWLQSLGNYYQNLESCTLRFEYELTNDPFHPSEQENCGSQLLHCYTTNDPVVSQTTYDESCRDDGLDSPEYSLLIVIWEAWTRDNGNRSSGFIGIFDLNQWYQAHMPCTVRLGSTELCSFFGFFSLEEIMNQSVPDFLLDVQIVPNSISQLQMATATEQHFFPSSLAFKICCLIETGLLHASYLGIQQQILTEFKNSGMAVLMDPREMYNLCIYGGLIKKMMESSANSSLNYQREAVLSVALENGLMDFINTCITQTSMKDTFNSSCSPKVIMDWAWKKAGHIKSSIDRICLSLYNCSGIQLEPAQIRLLHIYGTQLEHLSSIFQMLMNQPPFSTEQGLKELEAKLNIINIIHIHHQVVLWFYETGLLPEHEEKNDFASEEFAYPASILQQVYAQRRQELQRINQMIHTSNLLLIDNLISQFGDSISSLWEKDGGTGRYPPPNLYSLLNTYLLDGISTTTKHRMVQYVFLDLAACLSEDKYGHILAQLNNFPATFNVSPSVSKLTQAFWLLDHKDFEGAIELLVDPLINVTDIEPRHNTLIIKSFLYQNHCKKALKYYNIRQPALTSLEDTKLKLTVLLANELVTEAFHFQRQCRDQATADEIMQHFFLGCQQTKCLNTLFQLPLNAVEENALVHFLQSSNDSQSQEMLIMYFLQRNHFIQAMALNDSLKPRILNEADISSKERSSTRNIIVNGYASLLPKVQKKLIGNSEYYHPYFAETLKPQPLTTTVKPNDIKVTSQSSLIKAVMDKVSETWVQQKEENFTPFRHSVTQKNILNVSDNLPFVCTPLTARNKRSFLDIPEIIYPNSLTKETAAIDSDYAISPVKRSRYMDVSPTKRRMSKYANLELMSMLQTPPIHRKISNITSLANSSKRHDVCMSPQSILKVRQIVQRMTSPMQPVDVENGSQISSDEVIKEENMEVEDVEQPSELIPKQLRFDLPDSSSSSSSEKKLSKQLTNDNNKENRTLPQETNGDKLLSEKISPGQIDVSPRRPLHSSLEQPTVYADYNSSEMNSEEISQTNLKHSFISSRTVLSDNLKKSLSSVIEDKTYNLKCLNHSGKQSSDEINNSSLINLPHTSETEKMITVLETSTKTIVDSDKTNSFSSVSTSSFHSEYSDKQTSQSCHSPSLKNNISSSSEMIKKEVSEAVYGDVASTVKTDELIKGKETQQLLPDGSPTTVSSIDDKHIDEESFLDDSRVENDTVLKERKEHHVYQLEDVSNCFTAREAEPPVADIVSMETSTPTKASVVAQIPTRTLNTSITSVSTEADFASVISETNPSTEMQSSVCNSTSVLTSTLNSSVYSLSDKKDSSSSTFNQLLESDHDDEEILQSQNEFPSILPPSHMTPPREKSIIFEMDVMSSPPSSTKDDDGSGIFNLEMSDITPSSSNQTTPVKQIKQEFLDSERSSTPRKKMITRSVLKLQSQLDDTISSPSLESTPESPRNLRSSSSEGKNNKVQQSPPKYIKSSKTPASPGRDKSRKVENSLIAVTPKRSLKKKSVTSSSKITLDTSASSQVSNASVHSYNTRLRSKSPENNVSPISKDESVDKGKKQPNERKNLEKSLPLAEAPADDKKYTFSFSQPTLLLDPKIIVPTTPVDTKTFIFSPPFTRSRSKKGKRPSDPDPVVELTIIEPFEKTESESKNVTSSQKIGKKKPVKKTTVLKNRKSTKSPERIYSDSPINFVSPISLNSDSKTTTTTLRRSKRRISKGVTLQKPPVFALKNKKKT